MVKVLHIIDRPGNGGAEKMFAETMAALERRGKTSNIGMFLSCGTTPGHVPSLRREHPLESYLPVRLAIGAAEFPGLVMAIKKEDPDVIYAYHPSFCLLAVAAAGRILGKKVVLRRFGKEDALPLFSRMADRISYALCDKVVALSQDSAGELRRLGVPSRKICCIPNGKRPGDYKSASGKAAARKALGVRGFVFGIAGRITPAKGQESAIRALARMAGSNATLVLAGAAEDEGYGRHVRQLIEKEGLEGRVVMPGHMKDMPRVLAAFDAFVHTSSSEGCPGAVLEAMCAGLPIIAFDHGPLREVLGDSAILVEAGDESELSTAMEALMRDTNLRRRLGERSGSRVAVNFSAEAMASKYEELFTALAGRP